MKHTILIEINKIIINIKHIQKILIILVIIFTNKLKNPIDKKNIIQNKINNKTLPIAKLILKSKKVYMKLKKHQIKYETTKQKIEQQTTYNLGNNNFVI